MSWDNWRGGGVGGLVPVVHHNPPEGNARLTPSVTQRLHHEGYKNPRHQANTDPSANIEILHNKTPGTSHEKMMSPKGKSLNIRKGDTMSARRYTW